MRTKRYILTAIALLLVMVLCASFAFAAEKADFVYDGKTYESGKTIEINWYSNGGKPVTGDTLQLKATNVTTSGMKDYFWESKNKDVLEASVDDKDQFTVNLKIKGPGVAVITFNDRIADEEGAIKRLELGKVTINLKVLDANLEYTGSKDKDYTVQPGKTIDISKLYAVKEAVAKAGQSFTMADVTYEISEGAEYAKIDKKTGVLTANADADLTGKVKVKATLNKAAKTATLETPLADQTVEMAVYVDIDGINFVTAEDVNRIFYFSKEDSMYTDVGREFWVSAGCDHVDAKKVEDTKGYKWSSDNEAVVTVVENAQGYTYGSTFTIATLRGPGKANIKAVALDKDGKELVTNTFAVEFKEVKAKEITFDKDKKYPFPAITITEGTSVNMRQLDNAEYMPENFFALTPEGTNKETSYSTKDLVWSVDNTANATITKAGYLTAIKAGTVNVTATLTFKDGSSVSKTVPVTINEIDETPSKPLNALSFNTKELTIVVDNTDDLRNYLVKDPTDATSKLIWATSDVQIVSVSDYGRITARKAGSATITVTAKENEKVSAQIKVTVVDAEPATGVAFKQKSYKLWKNDSIYLPTLVKVTPEFAEYKSLSFSSSDPEIAQVDGSYLVGKNEGKATVTVTVRNYDDSLFTDTAEFVVEEYAITSMAFGKEEYELTVGSGDEAALDLFERLVVKPDDYDKRYDYILQNNLIVWSSNKSRIATVDQNGVVNAHAPGEVTIYAVSAKDKNIGAQVNLKVKGRKASKIKLNKTELTFEEGQDMTQLFTMTVQPATAYIKEISYKFSKPGIATVDEYYGDFGKYYGKPVDFSVHALGEAGETWLTVTAVNETDAGVEEKLTAKVKVVFKAAKKNLAFEKKSYTIPLFANKKLNKGLKLNILDKDTGYTVNPKELSWKSSDKTVATIDKNGSITVKAEGTTEITATTKDGNKTEVKTKLTVKKWGISKLTGSNKQMMTVGQKVNIKSWVNVKPVGKVYNDKLTLKSSDNEVVMVDSQGNLSALKAGEATITVTAKDDTTKTKTIKVTVVEKKVKK